KPSLSRFPESIYAPHDIFPRTFESDKNPRLKKCPVFKVQDAFHCCLLAVGDDAVHHYLINAGGNIRQLCFLHDSFVQKHLVLLKHCCNSFDKEKLPWCIATPCRILDDNTICCFYCFHDKSPLFVFILISLQSIRRLPSCERPEHSHSHQKLKRQQPSRWLRRKFSLLIVPCMKLLSIIVQFLYLFSFMLKQIERFYGVRKGNHRNI